MYIKIRPRYVHIPAQHELAYFSCNLGLERRGVFVQRFEESYFRREVTTTVRHIDRPDRNAGDFRHNDSILAIERGMNEQRPLGCDFLADVKTDARVAFAAVPITPVPLHLTQCRWHLVGLSLDLLQADDTRTLALDPLLDLALTRPDPIDVPGRELNGWRGQLSVSGHDNNQGRHGGRVAGPMESASPVPPETVPVLSPKGGDASSVAGGLLGRGSPTAPDETKRMLTPFFAAFFRL